MPSGGWKWRCFLPLVPAGSLVADCGYRVELHVNMNLKPLVTVFFTLSFFPIWDDAITIQYVYEDIYERCVYFGYHLICSVRK